MKEATLQFYKERMLRVLVHVQENLDAPLDLRSLAKLACLSPHHFHHVFTGMLGESLGNHVRRLRLERAAWRLKLDQRSVVQIALEAGYETHESFTRAFRGCFGISPSQYRRRNSAAGPPRVRSGVHYDSQAVLHGFRTVPANTRAMKISIHRIAPLHVAFMRHLGPYNGVGKTWEKLLTILGKDGWLGGDAQFIGLCHDDPAVTPPHQVRYDACVTVPETFRARGEIGVQSIAGGDYAVLTHFGTYEKLGSSYARLLGHWLPRSGRTLRSTPCFEIYFNSPEDTAPADLITDIHAPLEPV